MLTTVCNYNLTNTRKPSLPVYTALEPTRHSKLRNVVKGIYVLVKARYPILRDMSPEYDFNAQCNIVSSSFHPIFFIRICVHARIIKGSRVCKPSNILAVREYVRANMV